MTTRPPGPLQLKLLAALRSHGRPASMESLAALHAGLIPDLAARLPVGRTASHTRYSATARAVATLRRRGLVVTETVGTNKGQIEWVLSGERGPLRPKWRRTNPSTRTMVSLAVETCGAQALSASHGARENR